MSAEIDVVKTGKANFATAARGMYELPVSNVNAHMQACFFPRNFKKNKIPGLNGRF